MKKPKVDLNRLIPALARDRLALRRYRDDRADIVRRFLGAHPYDEHEVRKSQPVNLVSLYLSIMGPQLIPKNPRLSLAVFSKEHQPAVSTTQSWANGEIEKMKLDQTLRRVVTDALIQFGIARVCLATPADASMWGWNRLAGQPGIWRVDQDDFVCDMHARSFEELTYVGQRIRVPLHVIKESKLYTKARKELQPSYDNPYNLEGDERISLIGRGMFATNSEEFLEMADIWEIYIPSERAVFTLSDNQLTGPAAESDGSEKFKALREADWIGPETGPYHYLGYRVVPGNLLPQGPLQQLVDLADPANESYRKLIRQAAALKHNTWVSGGATEDGKRVMNANDGEILKINNPADIRQTTTSPPDQGLFLFAQHLWELFDKHAGNLSSIGGLSPQSNTMHQDEMLKQSASGQVQSLQDDTINFTAAVCKAFVWYWWHDPHKVMQTKYQLPGLPDMHITRTLTPQQRRAVKFEDLDIRVDPYSLQHQTPQQKLQFLDDRLARLQPYAPMMQQQGVMPDWNFYLSKAGEYGDSPDLTGLFAIQEPPKSEDGPSPPQKMGGMAQETTRNYNRRSLGGDGPMAKQNDLRNQLMAARPNGVNKPMGGQ